MSPPDQLYLRVLDGFTDVVQRVPQDRWDSASPCTEWNARQLTGHVIDAQHQVIALLTERTAREPLTDLARLDALAGIDANTAWHAVDTAIRNTLATVDLFRAGHDTAWRHERDRGTEHGGHRTSSQRREDVVLRRLRAGRGRMPIGTGNLLWTRGHVGRPWSMPTR